MSSGCGCCRYRLRRENKGSIDGVVVVEQGRSSARSNGGGRERRDEDEGSSYKSKDRGTMMADVDYEDGEKQLQGGRCNDDDDDSKKVDDGVDGDSDSRWQGE
ncbi:hypothetical protein B296_00007038 [Ensete ventricosum]|uniref:Uncharacterized protein n=1 Tax=Ensete ventricosum TaxID=4639 RepID=A0A427BA34_ENSVE|nr:hypothetical protein B296_00007038 [Ensete ventricosum]